MLDTKQIPCDHVLTLLMDSSPYAGPETGQRAEDEMTTHTTPETITDEQIQQLRAEAGSAGDRVMLALCDRALDGNESARAACARAISDAEAQRDE